MSLPWTLALALLAGAALGWAYFRLLWRSVRRLPQARRPGVRLALGFAARLALALAVFLLVLRWGGGAALIAALAGFIAARHLALRGLRRTALDAQAAP